MRFYRFVFWLLAALHFGLGLWFCFAPTMVLSLFGYMPALVPGQTHNNGDMHLPLIFVQSQGLFFWIIGAALGYVAESPEHGVPVVSLLALIKTLMPLFTFVGLLNGEITARHFKFELINDLLSLPLLVSYFFWFYHKPRPNRFGWMIGVFGKGH